MRLKESPLLGPERDSIKGKGKGFRGAENTRWLARLSSRLDPPPPPPRKNVFPFRATKKAGGVLSKQPMEMGYPLFGCAGNPSKFVGFPSKLPKDNNLKARHTQIALFPLLALNAHPKRAHLQYDLWAVHAISWVSSIPTGAGLGLSTGLPISWSLSGVKRATDLLSPTGPGAWYAALGVSQKAIWKPPIQLFSRCWTDCSDLEGPLSAGYMERIPHLPR